jgi:glycosyltransferase involved in cell wall biosynthesis
MAQPKVSVGVPVYNGERYLPNALSRLLAQDFEDFELIISDNASTDSTSEICHEFAARDRRIRYYRNATNIGLGANHNRTFELSRGQYFKWAAHDDDYPPAMLGRFVSVFESSPPNVCVVYSQCEYIDECGHVDGIDGDGVDNPSPRAWVRLAYLLRHVHMYNSPYGLIRSEMMRKTRLHGSYPMADHVFLAELAMLGVFVEIPEPLMRIRRHPGRTFTANKSPHSLREIFTPGQGHKYWFLTLKKQMELELISATVALPLPLGEKIVCTAASVVVPQWEAFRAFGGRQKRKLRRLLAPRRAGVGQDLAVDGSSERK